MKLQCFSRVCGALLLAAVLFACREAPKSALDRIERQGFLRAAYTHEPPYAFLDSLGQVQGESPTALRGALSALPVDSIRWMRMDFDELLPSLAEGRIDVVASGLFPSEERRREMAFTRFTSCSEAALLVRRDGPRPRGLMSFVRDGTLTIGVVRGAVEERAVDMLGIPAERVLVVPDLATGVTAVRDGLAAALALTAPTLRLALGDGVDLDWYTYEPSEEIAPLVKGCSALATRPGEDELTEALDRGLAEFIGSPDHLAALTSLGYIADDVPRGSNWGSVQP